MPPSRQRFCDGFRYQAPLPGRSLLVCLEGRGRFTSAPLMMKNSRHLHRPARGPASCEARLSRQNSHDRSHAPVQNFWRDTCADFLTPVSSCVRVPLGASQRYAFTEGGGTPPPDGVRLSPSSQHLPRSPSTSAARHARTAPPAAPSWSRALARSPSPASAPAPAFRCASSRNSLA